ncbi:MAG TPA: nucleotidyltransferase domain-containing protein [Polyangiaceae bacterium]|jgi:predicted nucleotidyltransferase
MSSLAEHARYLESWRDRWARQAEADARAREHAFGVAERLARLLVDGYGVRRVVLTGSLARGDFAAGSDIDLAVLGLNDADFFRAGAELEREAEGLQVDLVPIESATGVYHEALRKEGILLYGSND